MLDRHCEDGCWYCHDKCNNCQNPASTEYCVSTEKSSKPLKFCSKECQRLCLPASDSDDPTSVVIISSDGKVFSMGSPHLQSILPSLKPRCFPIAKSHVKVLHAFMQAENAKGFIVQKELIVCIGDGMEGIALGSKYIVHWSCTLHSQNFLEYHVDEDYSPTHPVDYLVTEPVAVKLIEAIRHYGDEQIIIKRAMKVIQSYDQSTEKESQSDKSDVTTENVE